MTWPGSQPLERKNYVLDQGVPWIDARRWSTGGVAMNFAGYSGAMSLRVAAYSPQPTILVTTVPSSSGLVGLDTLGNYWWEVEAAVLAALMPLQRALDFCLRVTAGDGIRKVDLLTGTLYLRTNRVFP